MRAKLAHVDNLQPGQWAWPHVDPRREWACKHCGELLIETAFLDRFEKLRRMFGAPLVITSGYRCSAHNATVSSTGPGGPHTTGRAMDVRIYGEHAFALVHLALQIGYTGVGLQQRGEFRNRFVHLDDLRAADGYPRPTLWTY